MQHCSGGHRLRQTKRETELLTARLIRDSLRGDAKLLGLIYRWLPIGKKSALNDAAYRTRAVPGNGGIVKSYRVHSGRDRINIDGQNPAHLNSNLGQAESLQ